MAGNTEFGSSLIRLKGENPLIHIVLEFEQFFRFQTMTNNWIRSALEIGIFSFFSMTNFPLHGIHTVPIYVDKNSTFMAIAFDYI